MKNYLTPKINNQDIDVFIDGINAARTLFMLSNSEKQKAEMVIGVNRGWDQSYLKFNEKVKSESFVFGSTYRQNNYFINKWPPSLDKKFRLSLHKTLSTSRRILIDTLYSYIPEAKKILDNTSIDDFRAKLSFYSLRSNYKNKKQQILCGKHTDFGLATLNISDNAEWLETKSGEKSWSRIAINPVQPIIWFGEQITGITDKGFKPFPHRISYCKNFDKRERFGISIFLDLLQKESV